MAITLFQSGQGSASGNVINSVPATMSATSAGSLLIASTQMLEAATSVIGPVANGMTDSGGNTWTKIGSIVTGGVTTPYFYEDIWFCANANVTNGTITVAVTAGGFPVQGGVNLFIHEYKGADTTPYDVFSTTGSITPAGAGEMIHFVTDSSTTPAGFTAIQNFFLDATTITANATFYESGILSCSGGTTTLVTGNVQIAAAFKASSAAVVPTVTTQMPTSIATTTATFNGDLTVTGGANATLQGFVYDTSSHALPGNVAPGSSGYASNVSNAGTFGVGTFTFNGTGLTASTTYFVRSFAQNSAGYAYGNEVTFTTAASGGGGTGGGAGLGFGLGL